MFCDWMELSGALELFSVLRTSHSFLLNKKRLVASPTTSLEIPEAYLNALNVPLLQYSSSPFLSPSTDLDILIRRTVVKTFHIFKQCCSQPLASLWR